MYIQFVGMVDKQKLYGMILGCLKSSVEELWSMVLRVWTKRNECEHGKKISYSVKDMEMTKKMVQELYERNENGDREEIKWLFTKKGRTYC